MADKPALTSFADLTASEQEMVLGAWKVAELAYVPYSKFRVGSVIEAENEVGEKALFTGCNVEIASYAGTICGERTAAVKAVSAGYRKFRKVALVLPVKPGGTPCGLCRQFLREFGGTELEILVVQNESNDIRRWLMADLLPDSFGPESLF